MGQQDSEFERREWDEEAHPDLLGPREGTDERTFADAGLAGSSEDVLGVGVASGDETVPARLGASVETTPSEDAERN